VREYEFTFVVQPEITEEGLEAVCQRFEAIVDKEGATKLFYEDWGRRRLAYEIKNFQKGHYLVMHLLNEGSAIPELERAARLDDSILRFLTVLADDDVEDIEARKAEAVGLEEERRRKAAERAEREAEEAAARAAEAEARAAELAAAESAREGEPSEERAEDAAPAAEAAEASETAPEPAAESEDAAQAEAAADDSGEEKSA
jgi:small subunit ribosomal protein S6